VSIKPLTFDLLTIGNVIGYSCVDNGLASTLIFSALTLVRPILR